MIKKEEIQKLADLARITLGEDEKESLRGEIDAILGYISEVDKVNPTDDGNSLGAVHNVMREDKEPHEGGIFTKDILENAPRRDGDYVEVKRILG